MAKRITVIQGHPDPAGGHLCHALADVYASGAAEAGHSVARIDVAHLDFPLLRSQADFEKGTLPSSLLLAREALVNADHYAIFFPLWLGTMPALVKAFFEQLARPGIAFEYRDKGRPRKLLSGRSARLVVTMGMPALFYRLVYRARGIRSLEQGVLNFVGIKPVRESLFGMVEAAGDAKRKRWLASMKELGRRAI